MKVLAAIAAIFGVVGLTVSVLGGVVTLIGAFIIAKSANQPKKSTKRRSMVVAGIVVAFFAGPLTTSLLKLTDEEKVIVEQKKQADALKKKADEIAQRKERDCRDGAMAFIMSRHFVTRALKAPSTAEYPSFQTNGVSATQTGECKFRVNAFVDAQNSFGAMIRTHYTIDMEYLPESNKWLGSNLKM